MNVGTLAVRPEAASAALVRRAIAADLRSQQVLPRTVEDVVLVASELVGNAVVHASASFGDDLDVSWNIGPDAVLVEVCDGSTELPRRRSTTDTETGGRGLTIVAALAADWGVRQTGSGKEVWARIPLRRTA
jgi:two-component sensor histidine kinase